MLVIDGDGRRVQAAADLWGLPAAEAEDRLRERLGPDVADRGDRPGRREARALRHRSATTTATPAAADWARCSGRKRLKAVAVRAAHAARRRPSPARRRGRPRSVASARSARRRRSTASWARSPTCSPSTVSPPCRRATSRQATFEGAEALSGEDAERGAPGGRASCAACTIGCEHIYAAPGGGEVARSSTRPVRPGAAVRHRRPRRRARRRPGCATRSAWTRSPRAARSPSRWSAPSAGLIDAPGLRFGNADALLRAAGRRSPARDGLGDLLAEGTRRAARRSAARRRDFAPHVKGLELPGYEPRALQTMALGFAVGSRGADHNRSGAYEVDFAGGPIACTAARRRPRPRSRPRTGPR